MIVRSSLKRKTFGMIHTTRISVGDSEYQEHPFPCVKYAEEIVVGMEVDFKNVETHMEWVENCEEIAHNIALPAIATPRRLSRAGGCWVRLKSSSPQQQGEYP
jgi:hypothetical protein